MTNEERQKDLITELDILYGENPAWFGFSKVDPPITAEQEGRIQSVWLTYRRGVKMPARAPPLHFSHDGKFKIMQVADLHFSVAPGDCRDTILSPCTHSDNLTNTLLSRVLDDEKPDLVVFTGDQLNGQGTSWDAGSVLSKVTRLVIEKKIPWAAVFGNHDSEDELRNGRNGREEQIKMMQALPYSLVQRGPKDVHGAGNYLLKVKSADPYVYPYFYRRYVAHRNTQVEDTSVDSLFLGFWILFERYPRLVWLLHPDRVRLYSRGM